MRFLRLAFSLSASLLVAGGCSSSVTSSDVAPPRPTSPPAEESPRDAPLPPPTADALPSSSFDDAFVRTAHARPGGGALFVLERPTSLRALALAPERWLVWSTAKGEVQARSTEPGILDAVVHPSGEVSALLVSNDGFSVARYSSCGSVLATFAIVDAAIADDPPVIRPSESRSPIEEHTHDAGGIAADGEDVFFATRTGRHSVVAYRLRWQDASSTFTRRTRTLVVPAHAVMPTGLTGGTYDTFGQLAAHYAVRVAVNERGLGFVGVAHARLDPQRLLQAHEIVFGEKLAGDPDGLDAYVTRVDVDGVRLGTSVVTTEGDEQLYGLRAIGDVAYALGRTEHWNEQGTGFEAFLARIDGADGAVDLREIDVDRGDIAFDVARDSEGGLVIVGASSYWQNPHGASLSEESRAFARRLHTDGSVSDIAIANGPRHNEARFVLPLANGRLWIGGMHDGPGTHSADSDATALRARGFTRAF